MFEYKVRARHKLGWKEFKLYADTDIEEFFNRKSIEYVRNMTDTVENKQQQEIERLNQYIDFYKDLTERQNKDLERLNNIINELEKWAKGYIFADIFKDKIKELKGDDED